MATGHTKKGKAKHFGSKRAKPFGSKHQSGHRAPKTIKPRKKR